MKEFWNERFGMDEYVYGTAPNAFLEEVLPTLEKGSILFPAEGEGRNATYAAQLGFEVDAFDFSESGKKKAEQLAASKGVSINYHIQDFEEFNPEAKKYDVIALIYAHAPVGKRSLYHHKAIQALKPGGTIIIEAFHKSQLGNKSGGPQNADMLFSLDELRGDFESLSDVEIFEMETTLDEGDFHKGEAHIIRMIGKK